MTGFWDPSNFYSSRGDCWKKVSFEDMPYILILSDQIALKVFSFWCFTHEGISLFSSSVWCSATKACG